MQTELSKLCDLTSLNLNNDFSIRQYLRNSIMGLCCVNVQLIARYFKENPSDNKMPLFGVLFRVEVIRHHQQQFVY